MAGLIGWHRLVGRWRTEGPLPGAPDGVVHGDVTIEWLEDQQCLMQRTLYDHSSLRDSLMVTAVLDGTPTMHYFDNSGVHSVFTVEITADAWRFWSDEPGNARRWTGVFADGGRVINGVFETSVDGTTWEAAGATTYTRA